MWVRYRKIPPNTQTKSLMNPVATDQDIQDWISRLRHGDQQATVAIYRGYFGVVTAFVRLHVDDAGAVEEIVDDTFLAAFAGLDQFEQRSSFKTWIIGIAKNKSHDWLRRAKREPAVSESDDELWLDSLVDPSWPAIEQVAAAQVSRLLHICLQRLSLAQREVTYFTFFGEMSVEQVAEQVCCAPGTVKSRLFHARANLAQCMRHRLTAPEVCA